MRTSLLFFLVLTIMAAAPAAAETLYVRAQPNVALISAPAPDATVVRRLTPGDSVTVLAREGGFAQVQTADGAQGWLSEADLTAVVPASVRVAELESELAGLRRELATAQADLRNAQAQVRQARENVAAARNTGAGQVAELEAANAALQATLATRVETLRQTQQRLAELEMAQEAARLLAASQPSPGEVRIAAYPPQQLLSAALAGLTVALLGAWLGASASRRRLRRRYHGLEL